MFGKHHSAQHASLPSFPQQQAASLLPCAVTWLPHGHLQSRWEFSNDTDLVKQHCQTSRYGHDMMNFLSKPLPCPVQSHHSLPVHAPVAICPSKVDSSDLSHCFLLLAASLPGSDDVNLQVDIFLRSPIHLKWI